MSLVAISGPGSRLYVDEEEEGGGDLVPTIRVNFVTGNDSNTRAQCRAGTHKWKTAGRACWGSTNRASPNASEAADAGDVVFFEDTQEFTSVQCEGSTDPWLNPVNEGTEEDPLIFAGDGLQEFKITDTSVAVLIGAEGRDYIEWHNILMDTEVPPLGDSGPCAFITSTGSKLVDCTITGVGWPVDTTDGGSGYHVMRAAYNVGGATNATPTVLTIAGTHYDDGQAALRVSGVGGVANGDYYALKSGNNFALYSDSGLSVPVAGTGGGAGGTARPLRLDNYEAVFLVTAFATTIRGLTASGFRGFGENSSAILTYNAWGTIIEYCDLSDCEGYGVFFKGIFADGEDNADLYGPTIVRSCRIHDCDQGGVNVGLLPCTSTNPCLVYFNIIDTVGRAIQMLDLVGDPAWYPLNVWFVNNTVVDCDSGFTPRFPVANASYHHHNNIYFRTDYPVQVWGTPATVVVETRVDGDRNCTFTDTNYAQLDPEGDNDTYGTPALFTADYSFIDANSIDRDPNFVNETDFLVQDATVLALGRVVKSIGGSDGATIRAGVVGSVGPQ